MTTLPNSPESRDTASLIHPYTNLKKHLETGPMIIRKGKGVWVYDDAGKGYIEGLAGLWSTSLGFGEERLVEAATKQMRELRVSGRCEPAGTMRPRSPRLAGCWTL